MVPPCSDRISRVPPYSSLQLCITCTGLSPTWARLSRRFQLSQLKRWPDPRSLATTSGVSVDVLSSRYLDVSVPWVCFLTPMYSALDTSMMITGNPKPEVHETRSLTASKFQLSKVGSPIRKSTDQSLFAAPRSISQRTTSFIASCRLGIHQMRLGHLIALISNAHPSTKWRLPVGVGGAIQYHLGGWTLVFLEKTSFHQDSPRLELCGCAVHWLARATKHVVWRPRQIPSSRCQHNHSLIQRAEPILYSLHEPQTPRCKIQPVQPDQANPTRKWWSLSESNRRHPACKAGALPTELRPQSRKAASTKVQPQEVVGLGRFELPTSRLSSARSNQLSYRPVNAVCVHEEERETKTAAPRV